MSAIPTAPVLSLSQKSTFWGQAAVWMQDHNEIPIFFTFLYLLVVYGGQWVMKDRQPYKLGSIPLIWNLILATFSIVAAFFYSLDILPVLRDKGFVYEICSVDSEYQSPWVFFFCLSKIPELFDTVLLVLRKRPVIFLHAYHHVTVMWFCWAAWAFSIENGGIFSYMNLLVHSIMYTYYAATSWGMRFPNAFRSLITMLQIVQMVFGTTFVLVNMQYCNFYPRIQIAGLVMYVSYGILFLNFFIKQYCTSSKSKEE